MFDLLHKHKTVAQVILALITLPFAFFGVDFYFNRGDSAQSVATVDGKKISQAEFDDVLREQQQRMRQALGGGFVGDRAFQHDEFAAAARDFSDALTVDPTLLDAAVHLGRIRMLEGQDPEARRLFERATSAPSRSTAYLARLFLGALDERDAKWDEAERRYRDAASLLPAGQSAALSLAALLDRRGLAQESTATISDMLDRTALRPLADPWWGYFNGLGRDPDVLLRVLRTEVSR